MKVEDFTFTISQLSMSCSFYSEKIRFAFNRVNRRVSVEDVANGEGSFGLDSRAGQIKRIVANDSPSLLRFFGAVLPNAQALSLGDALPLLCKMDVHVWYFQSEARMAEWLGALFLRRS